MTENTSLFEQEKDLSFYASRGMDKSYIELLESIRRNYKKLDDKIRIKKEAKIIQHTLLTISIESKNNSPNIAKHIIDEADENTLLNSIIYCFRTKEINEEIYEILLKNPREIINDIVNIDVEIAKKEISRIISNSNRLIEMIALKTKEKSLRKLTTKNKDYLTKKLPNLCFYTPQGIIENKLHETNNPNISLIKKDLIKYLEEEFEKFNQKNRKNDYEIYLGDYKLENDYILQIIILSYKNNIDKIFEFKIMLDKHQFIILTSNNSNSHFEAINNNTKLDDLQRIITKQIFNGKTIH